MRKNLLIFDSSAAIGRIIAQRCMNAGLTAECCRPAINEILRRAPFGEYDGILLFTYRADERLLKLVRDTTEKGRSVFIGLYTPSAAVRRHFRQAGAEEIFIMPCSVPDICSSILLHLSCGSSAIERIELFLEETGFPRRLSGFHYLAKAAELCINAPHRLWGGMGSIYEETAESFSTSPKLVERAMRNLSSHILENGALTRLTEGRLAEKPTNTELICAVCDMFSRL